MRDRCFDTYTDLIAERGSGRGVGGVEVERYAAVCGVWERVKIVSEEAARKIGRPRGRYHTLTIEGLNFLSGFDKEEIEDEISGELWDMCEGMGLTPKRILVAGLGNEKLTPDALGPMTAELIEPTMQIKAGDENMFSALGCSEIAVIRPSVSSNSGMDSRESIFGIAARIIPDLVIAVDSLCTSSEDRLGCTVQISDTGIFPGSGVGTPRGEVNRNVLGCPVIAIGVPTVIDVGLKSQRDGARMLVTPREINAIVEHGARIIAGGINKAFGISM